MCVLTLIGEILETSDLSKLSDETLFEEFEYLDKEKYLLGKKYGMLPLKKVINNRPSEY